MRSRSVLRPFALVLGLAAMSALPARAQSLPPLPAPAASFEVGSLHVDRFGSGPMTLVLIPGLGCGTWVWAGTIEHFASDYTIYAITLPGFDGQPMTSRRPLFDAFSDDFWTLLSSAHIERPVVVGHSLGGTLAIALAEQHPDRLRAVVALDGLPVFPALATATPAQRQATAAKVAAPYASFTHAQLLASEERFMQAAATDPALATPAAELIAKSDPRAIAAWAQEDLENDLSPDLPKVTVPLLELMPYTVSPSNPYTQAQSLAFYQGLLAGAPHTVVEPVAPSRHFLMLDQPDTFYSALSKFLSTLQAT